MKKISALFFAFMILCTAVYAAASEKPVYGDALRDGEYNIEAESSSSMFKITDCELSVSDGEMTAVITLSGKGYEKLFLGTGEEALTAPESEYIYFVENSDGKYTYTLPVEALDCGIKCAAWSIRREKWYDRELVFKSDGIPKKGLGAAKTAAVISAAVIALGAALIIAAKRKRKK